MVPNPASDQVAQVDDLLLCLFALHLLQTPELLQTFCRQTGMQVDAGCQIRCEQDWQVKLGQGAPCEQTHSGRWGRSASLGPRWPGPPHTTGMPHSPVRSRRCITDWCRRQSTSWRASYERQARSAGQVCTAWGQAAALGIDACHAEGQANPKEQTLKMAGRLNRWLCRGAGAREELAHAQRCCPSHMLTGRTQAAGR